MKNKEQDLQNIIDTMCKYLTHEQTDKIRQDLKEQDISEKLGRKLLRESVKKLGLIGINI